MPIILTYSYSIGDQYDQEMQKNRYCRLKKYMRKNSTKDLRHEITIMFGLE